MSDRWHIVTALDGSSVDIAGVAVSAHWGWPQWVMAIYVGIVLLILVIPPISKTTPANMLVWLVTVWVIWMGGFWL